MKVLIVNEAFIIRKGIRSMLEQSGVNAQMIYEAQSHPQALQCIAQICPQIIVADISCCGMDRARQMQAAAEGLKDTVFIFIAEKAGFQLVREAMRIGAVDFLLKEEMDAHSLEAGIERARERIAMLRKAKAQTEGSTAVLQDSQGGQACECRKIMDLTANDSCKNKLIQRAEMFIRQHYSQDISWKQVAEFLKISPSHFTKLMKDATGMNYSDYVIHVRIEAAKELLAQPELKIYEVGERVGYQNAYYFNRLFKKVTGMTPGTYKMIC